jgi:putative copper export protein
MYAFVLLLHILAASVWAGGHLFLALRVLPEVLRRRSAALLDFERRYEPLGMSALAIQVVSGLWLASRLVPPSMWLDPDVPASRMLMVKFGSLAVTVAFALDARFRVLPRLRDATVGSMVPHISAVTVLSVLFVFAGVGIRTGGWPRLFGG